MTSIEGGTLGRMFNIVIYVDNVKRVHAFSIFTAVYSCMSVCLSVGLCLSVCVCVSVWCSCVPLLNQVTSCPEPP